MSRAYALQRTHATALLAFCTLTCTACPYYGKPLAPADSSVFDERLLGAWQAVDDSTGKPAMDCRRRDCLDMVVLHLNGPHYLIQTRNEEGGIDLTRAYATRLGGELFLNIQMLDETPLHELARNSASSSDSDPDAFAVARIDFEGGDILVRFLADDLDGVASKWLRAIVQHRLNDPDIYDEEPTRFRRTSVTKPCFIFCE